MTVNLILLGDSYSLPYYSYHTNPSKLIRLMITMVLQCNYYRVFRFYSVLAGLELTEIYVSLVSSARIKGTYHCAWVKLQSFKSELSSKTYTWMFTVASSYEVVPNGNSQMTLRKIHDKEWDVPWQNAQHQRRCHSMWLWKAPGKRRPGKKTTQDLLYDSSLAKLSNSLPCPTAMEARVAAAEPKYSRNGNKGILWSDDNVLIITWKPEIAKSYWTLMMHLYCVCYTKICKPWWNLCWKARLKNNLSKAGTNSVLSFPQTKAKGMGIM